MKIRAVVSSVGARTPVGLSATPTAYLHRAAHVVMQSSPILDADEQPATIAVLPTLDPRMTGTERAAELGVAALKEAIAPLVGIAKNERIKLLCCLDEHLDRPEAFDLTSKLSREAEKLGAELEVATSTRGPAALGHALDKILDELERGTFTLAIVGGVHTDYDPKRIHALSTAGRLFTPDALDALIPGEAAAFVVLARGTNARRLGLPALLEVHDVATGMARAKPDNDESAFEASALTALVRKVAGPLTDAGLRCGWMLTDLSFETMRLYEFQAMTTRTQAIWCDPQYCDAPAQRLGYLGAAAIPLHLVLAAESWPGGFAPHDVAMSIAGSDGGDRAAILITAPGPEALPPPEA